MDSYTFDDLYKAIAEPQLDKTKACLSESCVVMGNRAEFVSFANLFRHLASRELTQREDDELEQCLYALVSDTRYGRPVSETEERCVIDAEKCLFDLLIRRRHQITLSRYLLCGPYYTTSYRHALLTAIEYPLRCGPAEMRDEEALIILDLAEERRYTSDSQREEVWRCIEWHDWRTIGEHASRGVIEKLLSAGPAESMWWRHYTLASSEPAKDCRRDLSVAKDFIAGIYARYDPSFISLVQAHRWLSSPNLRYFLLLAVSSRYEGWWKEREVNSRRMRIVERLMGDEGLRSGAFCWDCETVPIARELLATFSLHPSVVKQIIACRFFESAIGDAADEVLYIAHRDNLIETMQLLVGDKRVWSSTCRGVRFAVRDAWDAVEREKYGIARATVVESRAQAMHV